MRKRVLVVDDDQDQCELLQLFLERLDYAATATTSPQVALELVQEQGFDAVVTDVGMTEMSGIDLCERLLGSRPDIPVVLITGYGDMETAITAMRVGAYDFLTKPVDPKLLDLSLKRAVEHGQLQSELKRLREVIVDRSSLDALVGVSAPMKRVRELVARVAHSDASVLIEGETGTGKELVARAVHELSPRRRGPFVAINCAAVAPSLLESELFGHARGAFTDAVAARGGLFAEASGGTLFLDEIGELPLEIQPKLLRALQERTVRPVGSNTEIPFDVRIVAATHRDLEKEAQARRFREDLFYRINVVRIEVPPLRERGSDVLTLATHFLRASAQRTNRAPISLSPPVAERLLSYDWPGNVRELENCMQRAVALTRADQVTLDDLSEKIRHYVEPLRLATNESGEIVSLLEKQRQYIVRVVALLDGNKSRAAQMLGLDRRTLYRKLDRFDDAAVNSRASSMPTRSAG